MTHPHQAPSPDTGPGRPGLLAIIAFIWSVSSFFQLIRYFLGEHVAGWTDGNGHPLGEDFLNLWSAGFLVLHRMLMTAYDFQAFHRFQTGVVGHEIQLYHYSYPPVTALLSAPLGLLPYPVAWFGWQAGGWLAFALALRRAAPGCWLLLACAWPAVFVNAIGGQTGCWMAAVIGWGLLFLDGGKPLRAGLLFSLMIGKPQLGWIIPVALLFGGRFRALLAMAGACGLLLSLSLLVSGFEPWRAWFHRLTVLRRVILEDGTGVMHRMMSMFVLVRHAGASVSTAYMAQMAAAFISLTCLGVLWRRGPRLRRDSALIFAMLTATPYVSDYDCVVLAFPCAWLWPNADRTGRLVLAGVALSPLLTAASAAVAGTPLTALLLWAGFLWAGFLWYLRKARREAEPFISRSTGKPPENRLPAPEDRQPRPARAAPRYAGAGSRPPD